MEIFSHLFLIIYFKRVLAYDTVKFTQILTLSTIRSSERQQKDNKSTSDRPYQLLLLKKYSEQLPVIPKSGVGYSDIHTLKWAYTRK